MTKTKSNKIYAFIAATCFGVYLAYSIIIEVMYICENSFAATVGSNIINWIVNYVLRWALLAAMSISLFVRKRRVVIVASIAYAIYNICYNIWRIYSMIDFGITSYFDYLACCIAYSVLILVAFFAIKENKLLPKIWFLPGIIILLGLIFIWIRLDYFSIIPELWLYMIISIVEVIALFFTGIWLKKDILPAKDKVVNEYATFNPETLYSAPAIAESAIGGADKLKKYKELLDSGVITQEEFEAKKKQILGI